MSALPRSVAMINVPRSEPAPAFVAVKAIIGSVLRCLPASAPTFIYTVLLKPRMLRSTAQKIIKRFIPATLEFRGSQIALNQDDAIVSGSLALGSYETFVTDVLEAILQPGMTFFDIGANIGIYTALAARRVGPSGRVVAVEPGPTNVAVIQKTLQLNEFTNVTVVPCAAGDRIGETVLYLSDENPADHRLHDPSGRRAAVSIKTVTIDSIAGECGLDQAHLIKVDTQGWEAAVFPGMAGLLAKSTDAIVVTEFWPWGLAQAGSEPRALLDLFVTMGFGIYEIDSDRRTIVARNDLAALAGLNLERQHVNLLLSRNSAAVDDLRLALQRAQK